jgi:ferredoxin
VLNRDFSESKAVFEDAKVAKTFTYTGYLDSADVIINACKLKTHGMMGLSCAAKNMFGTIPGTMKPEYHFRYPSYEAFADMLVDLDEYFKPTLSVCDAIVGMEGNGPTAGKPRAIGCILASKNPHKLDVVAANIIGLSPESVPTLASAVSRELTPASVEEIDVYGEYKKYQISDYDNIAVRRSLLFKGTSDSIIKNIFGSVAKSVLNSRPKLKKKLCIGCNKCGRICPAKAIVIKNGKAEIDRSLCIRCFCCQEFCPVGAMKVHRTWLARVLQSGKSKHKKTKKSPDR